MRYQKTFEFCDTEEQAKAMCQTIDARATRYMRKHHPAYYTPWTSQDGSENKFAVWYYQH